MFTQRLQRGTAVLDSTGHVVGTVIGSYPLDGGGDPEFAIVRGRRFGGGTKLLPVAAAKSHPGALQLPFSASRIGEAPEFDRGGPHASQAAHARTFWGEHVGDEARRLGFRRLAALRD